MIPLIREVLITVTGVIEDYFFCGAYNNNYASIINSLFEKIRFNTCFWQDIRKRYEYEFSRFQMRCYSPNHFRIKSLKVNTNDKNKNKDNCLLSQPLA